MSSRSTLIQLVGGLCAMLCLTACAAPQPQQESTSPEVTQTISPQETETPVTQEEPVPTIGVDGEEIPNQDVEFGE